MCFQGRFLEQSLIFQNKSAEDYYVIINIDYYMSLSLDICYYSNTQKQNRKVTPLKQDSFLSCIDSHFHF